MNKKNKTWDAKGVWDGLERTSPKEYAIVLVGPSGKALWDYWEKIGEKVNYDIPAIDKWVLTYSSAIESSLLPSINRLSSPPWPYR